MGTKAKTVDSDAITLEQQVADLAVALNAHTENDRAYRASLIEELHGIRVALVAMVASKPALSPAETEQQIETAEAEVKIPRDAEVAQAAKVLDAEKVIKPEERVITLEELNALLNDAVERKVTAVADVKAALAKFDADRVSKLKPEQFDAFLKELGL